MVLAEDRVKGIRTQALLALAYQAGDAIMDIYHRDYTVHQKLDHSPVTDADLAAHHIILAGLQRLTPHIPVLSEESAEDAQSVFHTWPCYWLVDPLDGTKEFIKRNGEFTVNIALIEQHEVVWGLVYAPATQIAYWGGKKAGAFRQQQGCARHTLQVSKADSSERLRIVGSRSHGSEAQAHFLSRFEHAEIVSVGSSLKFCILAEGLADLYPRVTPTSEWDTAAGQAVLEGAGGSVVNLSDRLPKRYGMTPGQFLNESFVATAGWPAF